MSALRSLLNRLGDERGSSLVFALLTVLVTSVTVTSVIQYTTSNSRGSQRSEADQIAYALAEAGLNNGAAVLSKPSNNALDPTVLPGSEPPDSDTTYVREYEGGTSKWWGVLSGHVWTMHGLGIVKDPTGRTADVIRHATSTIKIQPTLEQELNNNAFNYMFAKSTTAADGCDVTLENSVAIDTSLFILGGLCFMNSSSVVKAAAPNITALVVGEQVKFLTGSTGSIGTSSAPIGEAHIAGGCKVINAPLVTPCSSSTRVHAGTVDANTVVNDGGPVADFAYWYTNAKPGPSQFCSTDSTSSPSSPANIAATNFEAAGSTTMSPAAGPYSVSAFNLTPTTSYTCRFHDIPPAQADVLGELSWNASTRTLKVKGVIFIDGSAYISNTLANLYTGLGTLYLAGTFTVDGSSRLCGSVVAGNCDFATWDPNTNNLGIITNGTDASGYGVKLQNSAQFQGSFYATYDVLMENFTAYDGPIVANSFSIGNNVVTHEFPEITSVPIGWPGNPTVYAEPQPPQSYSG